MHAILCENNSDTKEANARARTDSLVVDVPVAGAGTLRRARAWERCC
jgi:hypothetical protein